MEDERVGGAPQKTLLRKHPVQHACSPLKWKTSESPGFMSMVSQRKPWNMFCTIEGQQRALKKCKLCELVPGYSGACRAVQYLNTKSAAGPCWQP